MNCIFCKIVDRKIPATLLYEDANTIVIEDLHPQAEKHFLIIPKFHVPSLVESFDDDKRGQEIVGRLFAVGNQIAKQEGLLPAGYRSVINTGENGGQSVFHLHLHVLGGEKLGEAFA